MRLPIVAIAALVIGACNPFSVPPDFSVDVPNTLHTIDVIDQSGLVVDAEAAPNGGSFEFTGDVVADPENNSLTIRWLGGDCPTRPTVTLVGTRTQLRIVVNDVAPLFQPCTGAAPFFALKLTLNAPVAQDAVSWEVHL